MLRRRTWTSYSSPIQSSARDFLWDPIWTTQTVVHSHAGITLWFI
jgi:hypothetical protein